MTARRIRRPPNCAVLALWFSSEIVCLADYIVILCTEADKRSEYSLVSALSKYSSEIETKVETADLTCIWQ
jgi:hypothetical protein